MMDPAFIIGGLGLGLVSSLHCIGMCGPLVLSMPFGGRGKNKKTWNVWMYHAGRISVYALLGLLPGWIGGLFFVAGYQQWFSLIVGSGVCIFFLTTVYRRRKTKTPGYIQQWIIRFLERPSPFPFFLVGMANGLLPCGMVYMAVSYAALAGSSSASALFMICFGLGTFPLMMAASFGWLRIAPSFRIGLRKFVPYFGLVIGCLLVLRGMGLGIPFISPLLGAQHPANAIDCH